MKTVGIVGASGYAGGELLRLLIPHPKVEVIAITSRAKMGEYAHQQHPNLRKQTDLKFISPDALEPVDILFLAMPHGQAQSQIEHYASMAEYIVDLSADFRLRDADLYKQWYQHDHEAPDWLSKFVYGLPELYREELKSAKYVSGVGCNATACNLSLLPLLKADLLLPGSPLLFEVKVGSSEGGAAGNAGSHHPERTNVMRTFSSFGHRHTAEVIQESRFEDVMITMTSVGAVRGALATLHAQLREGIQMKDLWRAYRSTANENPFVRVVREMRGIYRVPEPKILAGSNYADIGFDLEPNTGRVVSICAIDNLMKGAAGSAVQSMNLMLGWEETLGLEFMGLHPL